MGKSEIRRSPYSISYFYCGFCIIECNKDYKMLQEEYKNVGQFYYFNESAAEIGKIWKYPIKNCFV